MKVSVLINSRNRFEALIRCLDSVLSQDYPDFEVIVLDDASDEFVLCRILANYYSSSRLRCIRSDNQLGVAGGRNKLTLEAKGEILCFIDDDAYFDGADALTRFVRAFHIDSSIGIVACKVINHEANDVDLLVPFSRYWRRRVPGITESTQYVSYYLGTCHAVKREVFEKCGLYRGDMMYGGEELDLSYRAIDAGYSIYYDPSIIVHHYPQPTVIASGRHGSAKEIYHATRNRLYLAWRYLPLPYALTYLIIWLLVHFIEATKEGLVVSFLRGLYDGIFELKTIRRTPIGKQGCIYLRKHYGRLWW